MTILLTTAPVLSCRYLKRHGPRQTATHAAHGRRTRRHRARRELGMPCNGYESLAHRDRCCVVRRYDPQDRRDARQRRRAAGPVRRPQCAQASTKIVTVVMANPIASVLRVVSALAVKVATVSDTMTRIDWIAAIPCEPRASRRIKDPADLLWRGLSKPRVKLQSGRL
jgi:hypothetical protein